MKITKKSLLGKRVVREGLEDDYYVDRSSDYVIRKNKFAVGTQDVDILLSRTIETIENLVSISKISDNPMKKKMFYRRLKDYTMDMIGNEFE